MREMLYSLPEAAIKHASPKNLVLQTSEEVLDSISFNRREYVITNQLQAGGPFYEQASKFHT